MGCHKGKSRIGEAEFPNPTCMGSKGNWHETLRYRPYFETRKITMSACAGLIHEPKAECSAVARSYSDGMSWVVSAPMYGGGHATTAASGTLVLKSW